MLPFPPPPPAATVGRIYSHGHTVASRGQSTSTITHRQAHLLYLHSLLFTLLQRHPTLESAQGKQRNADRVGRVLRVLWSVMEWRDGELWRIGMEWCGLDTPGSQGHEEEQNGSELTKRKRRRSDSAASDASDSASSSASSSTRSSSASSSSSSSAASSSSASDASSTFSTIRRREAPAASHGDDATATSHRIAFLRAVSIRRRGLRPLLLAHKAQEMMALGKWKEVLDEIELVIQAEPYRSQPELNLYAGLLVVLISAQSSSDFAGGHGAGRDVDTDEDEEGGRDGG